MGEIDDAVLLAKMLEVGELSRGRRRLVTARHFVVAKFGKAKLAELLLLSSYFS